MVVAVTLIAAGGHHSGPVEAAVGRPNGAQQGQFQRQEIKHGGTTLNETDSQAFPSEGSSADGG